MRILFILVPDRPGFESAPKLQFERFLGPYYRFADAGVEVVLASPDGGDPLMRAADGGRRAGSELARRFDLDRQGREALIDTLSLDRVDPADFDAAFCIGGGDAGETRPLPVLSALLAAGKPVATLPQWTAPGAPIPGEGLLLIGEGPQAPNLAAEALLGALGVISVQVERDRSSPPG